MNSADYPQRLAYVEVTWALLKAWLYGREIHKTNLPEDARVCGVYVDDWTHQLRVHFESKTFAPVREGDTLPRFELIFQR